MASCFCAFSTCLVSSDTRMGAGAPPCADSEPVSSTLVATPPCESNLSSLAPKLSAGPFSGCTFHGSSRTNTSRLAPCASTCGVPCALAGSVQAFTVAARAIASQPFTGRSNCLSSDCTTAGGNVACSVPLEMVSVPSLPRAPCTCTPIGSSAAFMANARPPVPPATFAAKVRLPSLPTHSGNACDCPASDSTRRMSTSSDCTLAFQPFATGA